MPTKIRVAIVHDWLIGGGAERVTHELHKLYPDAPIYTSYCSDEWRKKLDGKVITGYLQHWPFSKLRKFLVVPRIWWFTHLDLSGYDVVISVSGNGEAFGVRTSKNTLHVNYCNTPTHFYWRKYGEYLKKPGVGPLNWLARIGLRLFVGPLRRWDYKAAQRADVVIANSTHIQADIKKYYHRDSVVVYPPVDVDRFTKLKATKRRNFVTVGRQTQYKRTDLVVQACTELNLPLAVLGSGPEHKHLEALAGPSVTFLPNEDDESVAKHLAGAKAFLFAAFEDFGITPVEALAAGTPVIAFKAGGALDYIQPGKNGLFFDKQIANSLQQTLKIFETKKFSARDIAQSAQKFSTESFKKKMSDLVVRSLKSKA